MSEPSRFVVIDYTNWRGERRERLIEPEAIGFGWNEWHLPPPQWLIAAVEFGDPERKVKSYAVKDIHSWRPATALDLLPELKVTK